MCYDKMYIPLRLKRGDKSEKHAPFRLLLISKYLNLRLKSYFPKFGVCLAEANSPNLSS